MCPPPVITTMALWQLMDSGTDIRFIMYIMCPSAQWPQSHCGDMYNMYMYVCVCVCDKLMCCLTYLFRYGN